MSSSTTPLLPQSKKDAHPIFLRACHSPWRGLNQQNLMFIRGFISIYMIITFSIAMDWESHHNKHGLKVAPFELSNIVYLIQLVYQVTVFIWTFMHLNYPHYASEEDSLSNRLQAFFSPPRQNAKYNNRYMFSMFYTAATVFPHVVTMIYWLIIIPNRNYDDPRKELFGRGEQKSFTIINLFGVNSIIALIENSFLSSIKRQDPIVSHNIGLTALSGFYISWVYWGKWMTGAYVYWFLDPEKVGEQNVAANALSFAALSNTFFAVTYGITGLRENLTKKRDQGGYNSLPH